MARRGKLKKPEKSPMEEGFGAMISAAKAVGKRLRGLRRDKR